VFKAASLLSEKLCRALVISFYIKHDSLEGEGEGEESLDTKLLGRKKGEREKERKMSGVS
jgi:hypothetical protein